MSTTASINLSGSVSQMSPNCQQQNQQIMYQDVGNHDQSGNCGQVFHVAGSQPGQVTYVEEPTKQACAQEPLELPAFQQYQPYSQMDAQNQPQQQYGVQQMPQQYQQQQQYGVQQMPQQYQQQQQYGVQQMPQQYQQQQQYGVQQMPQQYQPQQQYGVQQMPQQYQPQQQTVYEQTQHQPYDQYHQQNPLSQEIQYQPIQSINTNQDFAKPPVFEAPISKIQIVKKNQSMPSKPPSQSQTAPYKAPPQNMQQSFRSSRSGSFSTPDEVTDPPHFVKQPESHQSCVEGDPISMTVRVIPAGDSNLTVQWYKDGQPLSAGSRFNTSFERGFAVLEILYTVRDDVGEYSCVAKNNFGMDQSSPSLLSVTVDDGMSGNSNLPREMADNIASMEANLSAQRIYDDRYDVPLQQPRFLRPMKDNFNLYEGQSVHLETIYVPINDSALQIEWHKNGKPLNNGCRFNMISDRGFAILDIIGLTPDDAGEYSCVATNIIGQAQSNIVRITVAAEASVVTTSQLPQESIQHLQALDSYLLDDIARPDFRYEEVEEIDSPPQFDIEPTDIVIEEGNPAKFLVKVSGYPRPRIQWLMNDSLAVSTSSQRIYTDGAISYFEFHKCRQVGQSQITVVAKNKYGEANANATLTVEPSNDFRPELKRIDPENPFRKLTTLKKVEVSPELKNAFTKQKPMLHDLNNVEKESVHRGKQNRSVESSTAESLYNNVQAKLKRSDRLSYSGASNSNVPHEQTIVKELAPEEPSKDTPNSSSEPVMQSSQMTFTFGKSN